MYINLENHEISMFINVNDKNMCLSRKFNEQNKGAMTLNSIIAHNSLQSRLMLLILSASARDKSFFWRHRNISDMFKSVAHKRVTTLCIHICVYVFFIIWNRDGSDDDIAYWYGIQ